MQANQNASIIHINDSTDEDDCVIVEKSNINGNNDEAVFNNNQKNINNKSEPNVPLFYCDTRPIKYKTHANIPVYNRLNIKEKFISAANLCTKQININIDDDEITEIVPLELVNENNVTETQQLRSNNENDIAEIEQLNANNENNDEAVFNNQENIDNNSEPNIPMFYCDTRPTKYLTNENIPIYNRLKINEKPISVVNLYTKQIMIDIDDDESTEIVPLELVNENNVTETQQLKSNNENTKQIMINIDDESTEIVPLELVNENNVTETQQLKSNNENDIAEIQQLKSNNENNVEFEKSDVICMGEIVNLDDPEFIITEDDNIEPEKRVIIVDGSNVAFSHSLNKGFSVKGLEICINHFKEMGHKVKAVIPRFRLQYNKSTDPKLINKLHENGNIVVTPCKNLNDRKCSSYDDRFILELASKLDAVIISNDNYSDLSDENPVYKEIIEQRVVGFAWCDDLFLIPEDPYGWNGPRLIDILHK